MNVIVAERKKSMENGYKVAAMAAVSEFTEKKSRFISHLSCVETEAEARSFIDRIRSEYPDATHNCVAYRLWNPRTERFSDDGEPAGTAGMPMLEVMKKENIYNLCVVVTRYFGGILLGGGGLIRAYSRGAADAIAAAGSAVRMESVIVSLAFGYSGYSRIEKYLEGVTHNRVDCTYGENITLTVSLIRSQRDKIISDITDLLCGDVSVTEISADFDSFK